MNTQKRNIYVRKELLRLLDECEEFALPLWGLRNAVMDNTRPPASEDEFDEALLYLEAHGLVDSNPDPLDAKAREYFITRNGRHALKR